MKAVTGEERVSSPENDLPANPQNKAIDQRLTICFPLAGDSVGGSHVSLLGLLGQLDPSKFQIIIILEVPDGRIAKMFEDYTRMADPVAARQLFAPGERFGLAKFARTFAGILPRARFLRKLGADIVHTNDGRTHASWAIPARLGGAKLVWHHRGDPGALGLRLAAPLLANKVLTVSSFALPRGGFWSAAHKAEVVHSPFDTSLTVDRDEARRAMIHETGCSNDTLIVGYFGSFVPRKRPLLFVDIMVRLQQALDRPVLGVMFGEAKHADMDKALREHIVAQNAENIVRIMGYHSPGHFWIAACDQLCVPAVNEPFGRTLIEAMLVGTPVVAARSGGNIEALENGLGLLAPHDDAPALAESCANLANDEAFSADLAKRAMVDARHRFGIERHVEKVTGIYAGLAERNTDGCAVDESRP
ncbi:MAG: glycosyltransferase family 4 protein [Sphingorhabdus sp.]